VIFPRDNASKEPWLLPLPHSQFWNLKILALLELVLLRKLAAVLEMANSVVVLTLWPIAVPITLTAVPTDTLVIFPRDNVCKERRLLLLSVSLL